MVSYFVTYCIYLETTCFGCQVAATYCISPPPLSSFVSLFYEALIRHPAVEAGKGNTSIGLMRMHAG